MQGLWLAGLVGTWGVASDWWHWQVDGDKNPFGEYDKYVDDEWDLILSYPENMYVQSMMLVMSCGGTCFKAERQTSPPQRWEADRRLSIWHLPPFRRHPQRRDYNSKPGGYAQRNACRGFGPRKLSGFSL